MEEKDKKNVPEVRFDGFDDEWKKKKLGDCAELKNGYSFDSKTYNQDGEYNVITIANVQGDRNIAIDEKTNHVKQIPNDIQPHQVLKKDDVLISMTGNVGRVSLNDGDKNLLNQRVGLLEINEHENKEFIYTSISSPTFENKMIDKGQGAAQKNIGKGDIEEYPLSTPSLSEQQKIAEFFRQLDKLIELNEKKVEKLRILKKSLLDKMFPDGGAIPRIRFKENINAWEQRKLPEFVEFFNGLTYTPADVRESGTLVLRSSNVKNGEVIDADNVYVNPEVAKSENVQVGDIIVVVRNGSRALIGKHAEIKRNMPNTVIGAFMAGIRAEEPSFANALLDTPRFAKEIEINMGATINQITGYMFAQMEFEVPSLAEQKQIGAFFRNLDSLITFHQHKCEKLRNLKISLLNKMIPHTHR